MVTIRDSMPKNRPMTHAKKKDVKVGSWVLGTELDRGGQGLVHPATHETSKQPAAVKRLLSDSAYQRKRMKREIEALDALRHGNIMPLLDFDSANHRWHVTPLGVGLHKYWKGQRFANPGLAFDAATKIIIDVLHGLEVVHQNNNVHRDIKPSNIIILPDNSVRIADFGIVHRPEDERITTRPAHTAFARHAPALYNPKYSPAFLDCLATANLWAWLVAADLRIKGGNYHWRFHRFINDDRCELVRACLAACSDENTAPANATAFLKMIEEEFSLASKPAGAAGVDPETLQRIREAQANNHAREKLEAADHNARFSALGGRIDPPFNAFVAELNEFVVALATQGVDVKFDGWAPMAGTNMMNVLPDIQLGTPQSFIGISCGDGTWGVFTAIERHVHVHEDGSLFSLKVSFHHLIPELRRDRYLKIGADGQLFVDDGRGPWSLQQAAREIKAFITTPDHWHLPARAR